MAPKSTKTASQKLREKVTGGQNKNPAPRARRENAPAPENRKNPFLERAERRERARKDPSGGADGTDRDDSGRFKPKSDDGE